MSSVFVTVYHSSLSNNKCLLLSLATVVAFWFCSIIIMTRNNNNNNGTYADPDVSTMPSSPQHRRRRRRRSSSFHHDVTGTMDRLRYSMIGDGHHHHHHDIEDKDDAGSIIRQDDDVNVDENDKNDLIDDDEEEVTSLSPFNARQQITTPTTTATSRRNQQRLRTIVGQLPAILLIAMFHLMIGIPFGVSYFPVGWRSDLSTTAMQDEDDSSLATTSTTTWMIHGPFPVAGKEALGIRMFLFSTAVGQVVFTFTSNFHNPIGLQMVENVPFCHALATAVIAKHGYGMQSLATCLVMFGVASVLVGMVFFGLGYWQLGRIVYFFPTHVLVGCIGGIGVFIAKTGMEVTMDANFGLSAILWWNHAFVLLPVVLFETGLRLLEYLLKDEHGKPRYSLLSPIYFCMITPVFYVVLWLLRIPLDSAGDFFFPALDDNDTTSSNSSNSNSSMLFDEHLWDMWRLMDFSVVAWRTIFVDCMSTMVALILFSLIHVPINIPAFAISSKTDVDMNNELISHGYSNLITGALGGLQNYMAYTQSVLYHRSGGTGKVSGIVVAIVTCSLFVIGPTIASYIPRCMAGTLLLHVGTDLFLEGVYDSYGKFDRLEYGGIWLIVIIMTLYGMDAAMIAGAIAAVSTYAVQSITYLNPIRGSMSAETLRSSCRTRDSRAQAIINRTRSRIHVIQLQGHFFFGNMAQFTDSVNKLLKREEPWIVILDFSLVLSIDSSAAQAIFKLQATMNKKLGIHLSIFVSGSAEGFPCEFNLSEQLSSYESHDSTSSSKVDEETHLLLAHTTNMFSGSRVYESLDDALVFAEDALVAREAPSLLPHRLGFAEAQPLANENATLEEEKVILYQYFGNICPVPVPKHEFEILFLLLEREEFTRGDFLWKQGSQGTCAKLLLRGNLIALLENEAGTSETIGRGNMIGELSLVQGSARMSSVMCTSDVAVLYSLSREGFEHLVSTAPSVARLIDLILIEYLANRVQHVSNRIFETRCLPI